MSAVERLRLGQVNSLHGGGGRGARGVPGWGGRPVLLAELEAGGEAGPAWSLSSYE